MPGKRTASETTLGVFGPPVVIPQPRVRPSTGRHAAAGAPTGPDPLATAGVLIVGVNYAPEELGIAPLTTGMARELAAVADRVAVFTGIPHHPAGLLPMVYRRQRRSYGPDDVVQVVRHRHYLPPAGLGGVAGSGAIGRLRYELSFGAAVLTTPVRHRPDLVIGVLPSVGGALAAARLADRFQVPLVLVVHGLENGLENGTLGRALALGRSWVLRRAGRVLLLREDLLVEVALLGVGPDRIAVLEKSRGALADAVRPLLAR